MRVFLIIFAVFFQTAAVINAEQPISTNIENIDLNIKEHEIAFTFLGLSAGEAVLIQGPNHENILVNIGGKDTEAELEGWLYLYDVKEISKIILTNDYPEPAFQQINQLISKYKVKEIITTPKLAGDITKNLSAGSQISVSAWGVGTKKEILPELTAEVQFLGSMRNEGLDFTLDFYNHRIFLMSSFSQRAEQMLLKRNLEDLNVFKIPNSAKEDSLSEKLIEYFNPQISILFADDEEQPDPEILDNLHDIWSEVYFTKKHGTVTIKFNDSNYEVFTIPAEDEE